MHFQLGPCLTPGTYLKNLPNPARSHLATSDLPVKLTHSGSVPVRGWGPSRNRCIIRDGGKVRRRDRPGILRVIGSAIPAIEGKKEQSPT